MSSGIIESSEELKSLYLNTDITDVVAVQEAVQEIKENVYVAGKEKYLEALNSATPASISKARKYNNAPVPMRYLGWGLMAFFLAMAMIFDDSGLFEESTVTWPYWGFWIGVGIQIYIAVLKNAWSKLTLSGAVIHSALNQNIASNNISKQIMSKDMHTDSRPQANTKYIFCGECGHKNKEDSQFCDNCGAKL